MARPAIHPGEHVADVLDELEISASEMARALDVPANRLTDIIRGQRGVTADTALRLGRWLGTGPEVWMNLQRNYDLQRARLEHGEEIERAVKPRAA